MSLAATPASKLVGVLWIGGLACLALITWWSPGATRMYAWPWSLARGATLVAPVLILLIRALDSRRPLALPSAAWLGVALAGAATVLLSGIASPYRAQSLLWSAPLLGGLAFFLAAFDWLQASPGRPERHGHAEALLAGFLTVTALVSLAAWLFGRDQFDLEAALAGRNAYPLGHSNYTAGLAVLLLPLAAGMAFRVRGWRQVAAASATVIAVLLLVSSGSRAGIIALAAPAIAGFIALRRPLREKLFGAVILVGAGLLVAMANPRTRAMFLPAAPGSAPNLSNVQRQAMMIAGWRMGHDRPLLGWGAGVTPLAFPRYRHGLDGGVENALQLHSVPVQIWAELGGVGLAVAAATAILAAGRVRIRPVAATALAGYALLALFDWQLDIPFFAFTAAALVALLAPPAPAPLSRHGALTFAGCSLAALAVVVGGGRADPTPVMNGRALAGPRSPADDARGVALLQTSLTLNPYQEIAHFNLGWLLVTADPVAAERHFRSAAHLVPDKGGVYFGLGLACLNQGRAGAAAWAFALECLNDPGFVTSPWWRDPGIAATRTATATAFATCVDQARSRLPVDSWAAAQLPLVVRAAENLGQVPAGPERTLRRERTGYPILMRTLDLAPAVDLYVVREPAEGRPAHLPPKGWLPSPLLLALLNAPEFPKS